MKFAVIGGDRRSALLTELLRADGHRVQSFALEKAELPGEIPRAGCLQGCVYGADCVILPVPSEKGTLLNAPYASEAHPMSEIISALWPGQLLCGGKLSDESSLAAIAGGVRTEDILRRRSFAVGNAALTAEGALSCLAGMGERSLWKSRILVIGWGRIGKLLSLRLLALGASVTAAARKSEDRAMAAALGCTAVDTGELKNVIGGFDYIVNTVPSRILDESTLCAIPEKTALLELASPPGGFDRVLADNIGVRSAVAPGLPGKYAPLSAAMLIRDTVYEIIGEGED